MMGPSVLSISFLLLCLLLEAGMLWGQQENRDVYVVYMGAVPADSSEDILKENHLQLLASVLQRLLPVHLLLLPLFIQDFLLVLQFAVRIWKS